MNSESKIISKIFYLSEDVTSLAQQLLGKFLVTNINGRYTDGMIVETEAYRAPDDRGCHAFNNRYTERTKTMFEPGGVAYVYICYGMHPMFNVVTGSKGEAHAILIRAIEPVSGLDIMIERRKLNSDTPLLTNGPAKLAVAMGITKKQDGDTLYLNNCQISIEDRGVIVAAADIIQGPRIGMSTHTGPCAHRPWRFYIRGNKWVSKPLKVDYSKIFVENKK
ncbi:MAG: DNA-3-methyladenine glycosylase [Saprospiraceae bacterium]|nr:DNA-3-methyladenine glycosylase [Saprospiraceae bacterium]